MDYKLQRGFPSLCKSRRSLVVVDMDLSVVSITTSNLWHTPTHGFRSGSPLEQLSSVGAALLGTSRYSWKHQSPWSFQSSTASPYLSRYQYVTTPCQDHVSRQGVLAVEGDCRSDLQCCQSRHLLPHAVLRLTHGHWPVHQIQVHIIQSQPLQALVQAFLRSSVVCAPQLRSHKDVLPLDTSGERLFESLAHLVLVAVYECGVDVSVTRLQCVCDCGLHLCGLGQSALLKPSGDCIDLRPASDCHVPNPSAGILWPVLRVKSWSVILSSGCLVYSGVLASNQFAS